jgi:hypothetical protein
MSSSAKIVDQLASGAITRERACDGKKAYRTPEFAEEQAARFSKQFGKEQVFYPCAFCGLYHIATRLP